MEIIFQQHFFVDLKSKEAKDWGPSASTWGLGADTLEEAKIKMENLPKKMNAPDFYDRWDARIVEYIDGNPATRRVVFLRT